MIIYCKENKPNKTNTSVQIPLIPDNKIIEEYIPGKTIMQKLSLKDNVNQTNIFFYNECIYFVNNNEINIYNIKTYKIQNIVMKKNKNANGFFFRKNDYVCLMYGDDIYIINSKNYETIYHHIGEISMSTPLLIGNKLFISTAAGDISTYTIHTVQDKLYFVHEGSTNHHLCVLGVVRNVSDLFNIGRKILLGFDGKVISCDYDNPDSSILVIEPSVLSNDVVLYSKIISKNKVLYVTQNSMITMDLNEQTVNQHIKQLEHAPHEKFRLPSCIKKVIDVIENEKYLILWCMNRIIIYDINNLKTPIINKEIEHSKQEHIKSIGVYNDTIAILKNDSIIIYNGVDFKNINKSANKISIYKNDNILYICLYSNDGNCEIISLTSESSNTQKYNESASSIILTNTIQTNKETHTSTEHVII